MAVGRVLKGTRSLILVSGNKLFDISSILAGLTAASSAVTSVCGAARACQAQ